MQTKNLLMPIAALLCTLVQAQDILWEKSYGGKHSDYLFDAQPTPDYGFILAGSSLSKNTGNKTHDGSGDLDYFIWKMDEKGELDWQKSFGGSGADLLQSIKLTSDGGFILAGTSDSQKGLHKKDSCRGHEDFWIVKLNARGAEQWQRTIGSSGQELLQSIAPTSDGGYIIGGSSSSEKSDKLKNGAEDPFGKKDNGFGNLDYLVVKLDSEGKIEWQKTYGGQYADQLRSIIQTRDGGYLLGGSSNSPESGNKSEKNYGQSDYWIIKLDQKGKLEWQKVYGGEGDEQLQAVLQSKDGNYLLAGSSSSATSGNKNVSNGKGTDFWMLKIDTSGEIIWQKTYDIGKADLLTSLEENADGSLLLGGHAQSEASASKKKDKEGINDYIAIKTDHKGEEQWTQSVGGNGEDILRKAVETRDGGYLLAGTSMSAVSRDRYTGKGRNDFWVVKLKDSKKKKEKKNPIEAYPNPTLHYSNVIVGYEFDKGTATVYDISGRRLQHFDIHDRTVPVDLGGMPEGIYIVEIRTNVQEDSVKIVKAINKNK
ncbi:T9SS type A sorting domain-containing protein [Sphingobacterium siyangense]|uniref:T9SS type A sorting domain-containing protein n=1 Tax=Sphingobacterium siyangense TaxID=459529 RepID=UPI00196410BB|nr:T9SS type A sorting domain-containing protein [Sphingobacterium siyangense]QRY55553.1 T9SS type A sorting domain-containing protein [Sphingobacterium siyangense]